METQATEQWLTCCTIASSHLFHLLSEGCEDLIAFSQGGLKLLKFVHVQGKLEYVTTIKYNFFADKHANFVPF